MTDRTTEAVRHQLRAMRVEQFEIGVRDEQTGLMMNRALARAKVMNRLPFLKRMNSRGNHIYIRPLPDEPHGLVLVDDLGWDSLEQLKTDGYQPAVVVETSRYNYQAWVRLAPSVPASLRTCAARLLAQWYEADPNSADWNHYGRLAGFTNRKPLYEIEGQYPFVLLRESKGCMAPARQVLLEKAQEAMETEVRVQKQVRASVDTSLRDVPTDLSGLVEWYGSLWERLQAVFGQHFDPSRADWWIAGRLYQRGYDYHTVSDVMRTSPGIGRKKSHQESYICRTAGRAWVWYELRQQGASWDEVKDKLGGMAEAHKRDFEQR